MEKGVYYVKAMGDWAPTTYNVQVWRRLTAKVKQTQVHIWWKHYVFCILHYYHNKENRYFFHSKNEEQTKNHLRPFHILHADPGNSNKKIWSSLTRKKEVINQIVLQKWPLPKHPFQKQIKDSCCIHWCSLFKVSLQSQYMTQGTEQQDWPEFACD